MIRYHDECESFLSFIRMILPYKKDILKKILYLYVTAHTKIRDTES